MRIGVLIVGILCSLFFLSSLSSASLSCSITTRAGCTSTPLMYLQNDSGGYENAHAQNVSVNSYAYALCCSSSATTLSTSICQSTPLFRLSNLTNAHLQFGNYSGPGTVYSYPLCLGSSAGNLTCSYVAGNCTASFQTNVGSLASSNLTIGNLSDAHYGSSYKYTMRQCCYIRDLYPSILFHGQTPADGSTQTATSIPVNLSSTDYYGQHYSFIDFDNSLVAGWRMDTLNGSGGVVDIKGKYNATNMSGAFQNNTLGSGKFGYAEAFDGTNDYLNAGTGLASLDGTNKTISAWVRIRSNKQQSIVDKAFDSGGYGGWSFWIQTTGKLWWWTHANKDLYDTGTAIPLNNWTHVAVVWNAHTKNVTFYLNGAFNSQAQDGTIVEKSSAPAFLTIGAMRNGSNFYLNGQIDEVLLFNRTFSTTEIGALYNASATKYYSNFTPLSTGLHTFKGYTIDVTGNLNTTELRSVTIASEDISPPLVTIIRPQNTTYTSLPIYFNVSLNENGTAWYSLTNGLVNYTMTGNASSTGFNATNASIADGSYTFNAYANDTTGNLNTTSSITFTLDRVAPIVTLSSPSTITYTSLPIYFNVSLNEAGVVNYTLTNGLVNYTMTGNASSTGFNATNASIADGNYTVLLYVWDMAGNFNGTMNRTFGIGASSPSITLTNPGNDVSYEATTQNVSFQFTLVNTSALANCSLFVNSTRLNTTLVPNATDLGVTLFAHSFESGTYIWNVSCTTVFGLTTYSATRLFTVSPPSSSSSSSSSGSSGGGGGGGGGATAVTSSTNRSTVASSSDGSAFLQVPEGVSYSVFVDAQTTRTIIVKNLKRSPVTLRLSSPDLGSYLSGTDPLTLGPGEEGELSVLVKGVKEGLLTGTLEVSDGTSRARIPVVLNVRSENFLFDVGVTVRSEGKIVAQGGTLKTQINLLQVGPKQKVDVVATYIIKDFTGKIYLEETETFYVLEAKDFVKEFDTSQLPEGTYIIGLEIQYPGAFATSSAQFEVTEPSLLASPLLLGTIVGALLVLGAGIIGFSLLQRRKVHHLVHRR